MPYADCTDPADARAAVDRLNAEGERLYAGADFAAAAEAFRLAVTLMPDNATAHNNLGVVRLAGEPAQALQHFERAVQLDPHNPTFVFNLSRTYLQQRDEAAARKVIAESGLAGDHQELQELLAGIAVMPAPDAESCAARAVKIDLGAGQRRLAGWITVDREPGCDICADLGRPLPFPDGMVDRIYASHLLEHFSYPHPMTDLLGECRRVLKPGGTLRVAVPNARLFIEGYRDPGRFNPDDMCRFKPALHSNGPIDYINYIAYMDGHHRYLFDERNLVTILERAGFKAVGLREFEPEIDVEKRRFESIYAEGTR